MSNNHYVVPSLWMLGRRSDMSVLNDAILSLLVLSFLGSGWSPFWLTHTHTLLLSLVPSSCSLFFTGPIFSRFPGSVAFLENGYWVLLFLSPRYRDSIWC